MKFFHLSHTDLDGYSAQFITKFYLQNIEFYNSNYGKEIDEKFEIIISKVASGDMLLITDLNLTPIQCENFSRLIAEKGAKILLLDHHQSGLECAKTFPWYFLDSSRSATKITYDFFAGIYGDDDELKRLSSVVNAVDIWQKDDEFFELGKVCMGIISSAKELNKVIFEEESHDYIEFLIQKMMKFSDNIALDSATHGIKKEYFYKDKDDTLNNLISDFVVDKLTKNREKFIINYADKVGILTYNIGNTSVIGNDFLLKNPDIDFFLDITSKKTMSFRANGNADVSKIAKHLVGGGGHINASGGMFAGFRDASSYENIKSQITTLIDKKTGEIE